MTNTQKTANTPRVSMALPYEIRMALVRASAVKDPVQRAKAIAEVEDQGRARFPSLFKRAGE